MKNNFNTPPGRVLKESYSISGFKAVAPRFRSAQKDLLEGLIQAHCAQGADRAAMDALFARCAAGVEHVGYRGHMMKPLGQGADIRQKMHSFDDAVNAAFEHFYTPHQKPPGTLIHVTCTGYRAPSGAQRLVSSHGWGAYTQVIHAYHMGCYAAHPALRMAASIFNTKGSVDVVHTELCSLHLDASQHTPDQIVIQSLFADGFIQYQVAQGERPGMPALEIIALHDEILPDSTDAMGWVPGPLTFLMTLSQAVPTLLARALPGFVDRLFKKAGLTLEGEKEKAVFAVHPGGPRMIDLSETILGLELSQLKWSRDVLREHGNMSSATLPHIWHNMLNDPTLVPGTLVASLGAGPGLTLSGALFRKCLS